MRSITSMKMPIGIVTEDTAAAIVSDIGVFGEKILTTTVPKESEFNGKHYVLERIEGADKQVGLILTKIL